MRPVTIARTTTALVVSGGAAVVFVGEAVLYVLIAAASLGLMLMVPSYAIDDGSEMHGWSVIQIPKVNPWKVWLVASLLVSLAFPVIGLLSIFGLLSLLICALSLFVVSFPIQETGKKRA